MRGLRRHPSRVQLELWFDGEAPEGLAWHLATCTSCFRYVDTLSRIRAGVRHGLAGVPGGAGDAVSVLGGSGFGGNGSGGGAGADLHVPAGGLPPHGTRRRAVALAAVPAVVLLAAGTAVGIDRAGSHGTVSATRAGAATSAVTGSHNGRDASTGTGHAAQDSTGTAASGVPGTSATGRSGSGTGPAGARASGSIVGLRLAVVAPTQGADAADGTEVVQAVQKAVAEANASGGVNGGAVQLTVVPAQDAAAVAALAGNVDAVVGGFGAAMPVGVPWLLPADPWAAGSDIVSTELSPEAAGARLGADLIQRGVSGTVGVIEGTGPDAALESGLASEVPVSVVQAPAGGTSCVPAVSALEAQGVAAVAVAGSPTQAASCVAAIGAGPWAPPGGILLAPSAAYAGVASTALGTASAVYTVLGLPWPASSSPGATRFRSDLPGFTSYRALVSYAAVELAVSVARATGAMTTSVMPGHSWRNDLYDFAGTANAGAAVAEESAGGWVNAP